MAKKKEISASPFVPAEEQPYSIPENWCWVYWRSIGSFIAGNGFKNEYQGFTEYQIPFYKVGSLKYSDENGILYDTSNTISEDIRRKLKATLIPVQSIIFAKIGEAIRLNRRSINIIPCCIDNNLMAFCGKGCYYLYAFYWSLGLDLYAYTNATTVPAIRKSDLEAIPFPLAPLFEQQRIVDRIESLFVKLDEAKAQAQAVVDGFELRKSAILHKAFTGELVGISSGRTVPLETIVETIRIGPFGSALHKEDYITGGIPVVNPKHIVNQQIVSEENVTITGEKASELMAYRLKTGDIIMGRRGEMGRSASVTEKENGWLCGTGSLIIRLQEGYNGALYSQIIASHSSVQYLEENCVGSTMKNLNEKVIKSLPVPNYTKEQQNIIVAALNSLLEKEDQAKKAAEDVLDLIDTMKRAILARAFRGELGTNDPAEEWAGELVKSVL